MVLKYLHHIFKLVVNIRMNFLLQMFVWSILLWDCSPLRLQPCFGDTPTNNFDNL